MKNFERLIRLYLKYYRIFQFKKRIGEIMFYNEYEQCLLCPRRCGVNRKDGKTGFCNQSAILKIGRASLHMWEEPCISGENGSGTVFFSGCSLRCCYCQNFKLSRGEEGVITDAENLSRIFINLQEEGAHNVNLVTGEHFAPHIKSAVEKARKSGLTLPVILNSSGYVSLETLEFLKDVIDIYLVDFKYMDPEIAEKYSSAKDYPDICKKALEKMYDLVGKPEFDHNGMMKKGVIVRHLCLPLCENDSKKIISYVHNRYKENVLLSIMSQYTPFGDCEKYPELTRKLTSSEYNEILDFCLGIGVENAFIQEEESASESFIPSFKGEGVVF